MFYIKDTPGDLKMNNYFLCIFFDEFSLFLIFFNFMIFHEILWFSSHFGVFAPMDPSGHRHFVIKQPFKAKKVTFWKVSRDSANFTIFAPKMNLLRNSKKICIFSVSGSQNQFFRLGASKKAPRTLRLSLLLRRGRRSSILDPKEQFWTPEPKIS